MSEQRSGRDGERTDLHPPHLEAGERDTQVAFLHYLRESVLAKAEGLPDELGARPVVPSGTSLLGLVKHLTDGENHYILRGHAGLDGYDHVTFSMAVGLHERGLEIIAAYRDAIRRANDVIAGCEGLDERGKVALRGDTPHTMRWVLAHLIEETGRHAGHADILRELIDGSTGR